MQLSSRAGYSQRGPCTHREPFDMLRVEETCLQCFASLSMNVVTKAAMVSPLYSSHHWFDDSLVKADHLAQRPTAALYNRTRNSL